MEQYMREIDMILCAIDEITVKGEKNHEYMLLAMQKLHNLKNAMQTERVEEAKKRAAENKCGE